ncbi:MAG TPA: hypothetical protein VMV43_10165 [Candidatus Nanopelagicaceae bacterium]|nr:hypothetical protein [Candidatus Nanopelagicaceae bacterium]
MTFFTEEVMQRIRYLHYKIKKIEEALDKEEETFNLDDLNLVLEYTKTLNINYQNEDQIKLLKDLDITPTFLEPLENNREIQIKDIMFECARNLWVMARAYSHISENFEADEEWEDAIIAMVECSKIFKTGAYFSAASINQHDLGITLSSENLELNSEEARILAQSIAALKEENSNNTYFASKLYAGLSSLSKRLFYLKKHEEKKKQQLRAQFHFDMGKACQLKAQASLESSITNINKDKVTKLQQKAYFYFLKSEEIWSEMISSLSELSNEERSSIEQNLSIVKDILKDKNLDLLDYEEIKRIQDPEPIIIIPENLAPFVPKSTVYLTKFVPKDLNIKRFKSFQKKKLEQKIPYSKRERLIDKKAGIVRTINELKLLKENKEIDIDKFAELLEKYSTKLKMIDTAIEKLAHITK